MLKSCAVVLQAALSWCQLLLPQIIFCPSATSYCFLTSIPLPLPLKRTPPSPLTLDVYPSPHRLPLPHHLRRETNCRAQFTAWLQHRGFKHRSLSLHSSYPLASTYLLNIPVLKTPYPRGFHSPASQRRRIISSLGLSSLHHLTLLAKQTPPILSLLLSLLLLLPA